MPSVRGLWTKSPIQKLLTTLASMKTAAPP